MDQSRKACRVIRDNLESLQIKEGGKILEMDLTKALSLFVREGVRFDLAFIDPPYEREDLYEAALRLFGTSDLLAQDGLLILEHSKRKELPESSGILRKTRSLVQGDAALAFYTATRES